VTIFFLISSEGYYGVENMLVALALKLSQKGCRCVVGVFGNSRVPHTEVAEQAERQGLAVEIIACNGRWDWSAVAQIRRLLAKHDVDVLHPHGYKADLYALAAARRNRVGLLATSHNWPSKLLSMRVYAVLDRLALRTFDKVIVVSDVVADILRRSGVAAEKVALIPNGVDLERFQSAGPKLRTENGFGDNPVVGFVGRLVPDKGGALLVRAAQQVLAMRPNATFVLVGEGPAHEEWKALAGELGINDQVIFAGVRDDMPEVYASFDMVVLPSLIEALPMCLLEAMAAGRPVIATRVGAVPRLVVDGQTGLLLEPGDVSSLAQAVLRLLENPDMACQLGENGRAHVAQHFSAEVMAKSYIGMYEQVLVSRGDRTQKQAALEVN
jgi:glycosyltransferase involved in cell wall biosynthesis